MSRQIEIEVMTDAGTVVRGYGARELVTDHVGQPPVWATISRGWCVQTWRVADLVAIAERRGLDVRVVDERDQAPAMVDNPELGLTPEAKRKARLFAMLDNAPAVEQPDPGRLRW